MPKFGPPKQSQYDPFNAISSTLSALADPAEAEAEAGTEQVEQAPEVQQPAPIEPVHTASAQTLRPASRRRSQASPAPERDKRVEGSGGVQADGMVEPQPRPAQSKTPADQLLSVTKRVKTTRSEGLKLDHAALRLSARLGVNVDLSKLTRALWEIYLRHEEDIIKQAPNDANWERPSNNDAVGLAELDESIAEVIENALLLASMRQRNRR